MSLAIIPPIHGKPIVQLQGQPYIPVLIATSTTIDASIYTQGISDAGIYSTIADALVGDPTATIYDPGQLWSHTVKYGFLRFRANNIPGCSVSSNNNRILTAYGGNDTITSILPNNT
jgi:hypothetical protein